MRRNLTLLVLASTSAVVLALVIPLGLLVGRLASDRAVAAATQQAQSVALLIATGTSGEQLRSVVELSDQRTGLHTSVAPPASTAGGGAAGSGTPVGVTIDAAGLTRARAGEAFTTYPSAGGDGALVYLPVATSAGTSVVRVGVSPSDLHQGVTSARILLVTLAFGLVLASLLAALVVSRRMAAPLVAVADVAHDLRSGRLGERVDPAGPAEVQEVGTALNALAARIGELLQAEREAAADLSHRLRTPVTALRLAVDTTPDPDERVRLREHLERLEATVDGVVRQARQPSSDDAVAASDLAEVAAERVAFWSALAEDQGRRLDAAIAPGPLPVPIAEQDLVDLLDVLLDNVFAHTPLGTPFRVVVKTVAGGGRLEVADEGPGLPAADALGRGRSHGGSTGLGLDIVTRLARMTGASVDLGATTVDADGAPVGARVTITWATPPK